MPVWAEEKEETEGRDGMKVEWQARFVGPVSGCEIHIFENAKDTVAFCNSLPAPQLSPNSTEVWYKPAVYKVVRHKTGKTLYDASVGIV